MVFFLLLLQSNCNGSNTLGVMKIYSRQGMFELMSVNHSARPRSRDVFSIVLNMKVCSVFSLESPHRGNSTEYTISHSQYEKENNPKLSQICSYWNFPKGPKNEFETTEVNDPSVFEPLKFYYYKYRFPFIDLFVMGLRHSV